MLLKAKYFQAPDEFRQDRERTVVWEKLRRRGALRARSRRCRVDWGRISGGTRADSAAERRGPRGGCSTNHSVRAAARTRRKVLAPTTRSRLRHWSCPKPAKALLSRMVISTAHRSRYWARIASRLSVRSVVKNASTGGGGLRWPGFGCGAGAGRRTTTTRISRPGSTACHSPSHAWTSAPASVGWGCQPDRLRAKRFR